MNVLILAAGQGKRMKSKEPKVLHTIVGQPMIKFVVELARSLAPKSLVVVVAREHSVIKKIFKHEKVKYAVQDPPRGTGDAAKKGLRFLKAGQVLILSGDVPLLKKETVEKLMAFHKKKCADLSVVCARMDNPYGYGRVIRNRQGQIERIVEEADASPAEKSVRLINGGIYLSSVTQLKKTLKQIRPNNRQKEYYLTDAVKIIIRNRGRVYPFIARNPIEIENINSRSELLRVRSIMKERGFEKSACQGQGHRRK